MVQFVAQKKFTKQRSSSGFMTSSPMKGRSFGTYLHRIPLMYFWIFFGILVFVYGTFLLLKYTLFQPQLRIQKIDYALKSWQLYDDPYLYKRIKSLILNENMHVVDWQHSKVVSAVQKDFPFVEDIHILYKAPYTVFVKVLFHDPELIFLHDNKRYGVYDNHMFELFTGNQLGLSGVVKLEVLSFNTGGSLSGIFFQDSFSGVMEDIRLIKEGFPDITKLSYIPGGHRMVVSLGGDKKVYVNNAIDIKTQIVNYQLLKKYYADFPLLKEIDLGSLESDKVIVKK